MTTSVVIGAAHSGRAVHARALLARHPRVTWMVPADGRTPPAAPMPGWDVVVTEDLGRALMCSRTPVLVDDLEYWVRDLLRGPEALSPEEARLRIDHLLVALTHLPHDVVVVSNQSPTTDSPQTGADTDGELLSSLLGEVNRRVVARSALVHLVVAGRVLDLSTAPVAGAPLTPP